MIAAWWRFTFQRCKVCSARCCPVWGAFGTRPAPTIDIYREHAGFEEGTR